MSTAPGDRRRVFGFGVGTSPAGRAAHDRFDALTVEADEAGVAWRDLVRDGYRVAGDLTVGGVTVRTDWSWRVVELERRLREQASRP